MSARNDSSSVVDDTIPLGGHDRIPVASGAAEPAGEVLALSARGPHSGRARRGGDPERHRYDITVVTHEPVASEGVETLHVMDSGLDVSGFGYCTFAGGITVFYPPTQRLLVTDES